ncbi:tetratricopeptide repeat protein [Celeribacter litoreus]|uniref:tetratricopeptide repeat protein n=1 Tax=Celeribacter litoreus TaxID=2876714 RepID=UPI001CD01C06|nr:tetratricopeptide repeat protein [Celeribacter litoreus]MCA0044043.1 tetratricopeptide repeat protein [Celeribacter litoreus]
MGKPSRLSRRALVLTAVCASLLAACADDGVLAPLEDGGAYAPPGVDPSEVSVDGLTVGHRLMAAEEYELALKAYYRAAAHEGMTVDTRSAIGSAKLRLGRLGQAEQDLRLAIEMDETFVPAWNNLGVVLMEQGDYGEAERVFRTAFALDSGQSAEIRENLRLALAKLENPTYSEEYTSGFTLVRRGTGDYQILAR